MAADSPAERQIVIRAIAAGRPAIARQMPPELGSGARELAVVDRDRIRAAAGLVVRYADVPIGLADASCIVLPEAYRDRVIAILDRHPRSPPLRRPPVLRRLGADDRPVVVVVVVVAAVPARSRAPGHAVGPVLRLSNDRS